MQRVGGYLTPLVQRLPSPLVNLSKSTKKRSMKEPVMKPKAGPMEVAARRRPAKKAKQ